MTDGVGRWEYIGSMEQQGARNSQKVCESDCLKWVKEKQELQETARITVWFSGKTGGGYSPAFRVAGAPESEGFQYIYTVGGEH